MRKWEDLDLATPKQLDKIRSLALGCQGNDWFIAREIGTIPGMPKIQSLDELFRWEADEVIRLWGGR